MNFIMLRIINFNFIFILIIEIVTNLFIKNIQFIQIIKSLKFH